jgi:hypothetical protein
MYLIPSDLAQAVANYLGTRPYGEVFGLINGMQAMQPVEEPELGPNPESADVLPDE